MKQILFVPLLFLFATLATAQTNPNLIDFEPSTANLNSCGNYSQPEGASLDNNFFMCAYNITFHVGSLGGPAPIVAEVGDPMIAWASGTTFSYSSVKGCTVATGVSGDKPTNNKDIGCFCITDDPDGPGQNPDPLYVDYHDLECTEASGYLMDVDGTGTNQEGWAVTAHGINGATTTVYVLAPGYSSYATPPTPQVNAVGGDGEASYWGVTLSEPIDYIEFRYIGNPARSVGLAFDEFAICSQQEVVEARGCCDDIDNPNLVVNGSFEAGNIGFTTGSYVYQGIIAPNSVSEGRYSVLSGNEAGIVSNCWNVVDHTTCTEDGHFMVVNGRTHNPMSSYVYQQQDIIVEEGQEYIFCMFYQHLPQCAFDVFSPDNMHVFISGADITGEACEDDEDHCGWTKISYSFVPTGSSVSLEILLNEGGIGDGNDVAFDDFSIRKKEDMPAQYCTFDVNSSTSGSTINFTATAVTNPLPAGFDVTWTVTEADCNTWTPIGSPMSLPSWNPYVTNFPGWGGTSPGTFSTSKCYIITRKVSNCCYNDCEHKWYWLSQPEMMMGAAKGAKGDDDSESQPYNGMYYYMSQDKENWTEVTPAVSDSEVKIFPNPGDGNVTIVSSLPLEGATLMIYNAEGRVVQEQQLGKNKSSINITSLPNGVYSFNITQADGNTISKTYIKQ